LALKGGALAVKAGWDGLDEMSKSQVKNALTAKALAGAGLKPSALTRPGARSDGRAQLHACISNLRGASVIERDK
jgi:hypothetical protein